MFSHMLESMNLWLIALLSLFNNTTANYIRYSTVTGYFLQDEKSTNATTFDYTAVNFGLINQTYESASPTDNLTQWQQFASELDRLQAETDSSVSYRILFLGRHGQGYHNTAESYYGTPAWNCYYSLLDGNATSTWADAHLTSDGIDQALVANRFWQHELDVQKIHPPQSYYTSPLFRCLQTANFTFSGIRFPLDQSAFVPTVKEFLREGISEHTCDRRSNRTFIQTSFPSYRIEPGFTEQDELWTGIYAETESGQDRRSKAVLDDIFTNDNAQWISITAHSGEISSLLRVLGHRSFNLNTGAVIPVFVKAETVSTIPTVTATSPDRTPSAHCTGPPATSNSASGCVCWHDQWPTTGLLATQTP